MKLFISYRHTDKPELVELLTRELNKRQGISEVFQDIFSIPPGIEFDKYIRHKIEQMDAVLVAIGTKWIDEFGARKDITDFVLLEVEAALKANKLTIPILIDGAKMPKEEQLPESIKSFARRNAIPIRSGKDLDNDIDELLSQLRISLDFHKNISSDKPGQRLLALQEENLSEIWKKTQAKIYELVYKETDSKLFEVPRMMNQAELRQLEFHTIVYAVNNLETCKYLNTTIVKRMIEDVLSDVIGVRVFTECQYKKHDYFEEFGDIYNYMSLQEALKESNYFDEDNDDYDDYPPPPQDLDDIPF